MCCSQFVHVLVSSGLWLQQQQQQLCWFTFLLSCSVVPPLQKTLPVTTSHSFSWLFWRQLQPLMVITNAVQCRRWHTCDSMDRKQTIKWRTGFFHQSMSSHKTGLMWKITVVLFVEAGYMYYKLNRMFRSGISCVSITIFHRIKRIFIQFLVWPSLWHLIILIVFLGAASHLPLHVFMFPGPTNLTEM